jgi:acetyl-CoA carboxylase carboxyl transferase subunit beta
MVDMVVHRHKLRTTLSDLCRLLVKAPPREPAASLVPDVAHLPAPASA